MGSNKVGKITVGLSLLMIGIALLLGNWLDFSLLQFLSYLWPLVLIMLGIEYVYKRRQLQEKKEGKLSFDGKAVVFIFIILLISGGLFSLKGSTGFQFALPFGEQWKTEVEISERYDVAEMDALSFQFINANIEIIGDDTSEIVISGLIKSNEDNEDKVLKTYQKERKVKERADIFEYMVTPSSTLFSRDKNFLLELEIIVPHDRFLELEVVNGFILAQGLSKDAEFQTVNGVVEAKRILGSVDASSTNGKINLMDIGGHASAETVNGKISVENIAGELDLEGVNGSITVDSDKVGGDWDLSTINGTIKLSIPANASVDIEGETSNGSVKGNLAWEREHSGSQKNKQGSAILNDGEFDIHAESVNGSIQIDHN